MEMEDRSCLALFALMRQPAMSNVHNTWLAGTCDFYENSGRSRKCHYLLGQIGILKSGALNLYCFHLLGRPRGKYSALTAGTHGSCGLLST